MELEKGLKVRFKDGPKMGKEFTIKSFNDEFIYFEEEDYRIYSNLVDELLENSDSQDSLFTIPLKTPTKKQDPIPLKNTGKNKSAMYELLKKQKNTDFLNLEYKLNLSIPKESFIMVLLSSFESEEVKDEILYFLLNQLNKNEIIEDLKSKVSDEISQKVNKLLKND